MNKKIGPYTSRTHCRFCDSGQLSAIIDFGLVPLAGAFLKQEDVENEFYYPLTLQLCRECYLVQVKEVIPAETLFKNYFYFSSSIGTLVKHCEEYADEVVKKYLKDKNHPSVFEIGCNDGVMLRPFAKKGIRAVGIDPAENVVKSIQDTSFTVINNFFNENIASSILAEHGPFDAVVSSYSFAHIDNMISVMKGIKKILNKDGVFIFEVYYLGTMIDEMQYDNIYHEHMSYYSLVSLERFLNKFNMELFDIKFTPGVRSGAVRFYAQNTDGGQQEKTSALSIMRNQELKKGYDKLESFLGYVKRVEKTRTDLIKLLKELKAKGKTIIGYGASGRGTTIMNYCGIDGKYLDYIVDDAPAKKNYLTPGTHVPIQNWEYAETNIEFPEYALLFAWSFIEEVKKRRLDYLNKGGKFIIPLPEVSIQGKND
jgi:methylation protein EvaC